MPEAFPSTVAAAECWLRPLGALAEITGCTPRQSEIAASELARLCACDVAELPRVSGIAIDGGAFECSVKVCRGRTALRFIVDPLSYSGRSSSVLAVQHVARWCDNMPFMSEILSTFSLDAKGFAGNFRVWTGVAVASSGHTSGKLYINPNLPPAPDGLTGILRFLSRAGVGATAVAGLNEVFASCGGMVGNIVGVNLAAGRKPAFKAYVVLTQASASQLLVLAHPRTPLCERLSRILQFVARPRGEIHVTLSCSEAAWSLAIHFLVPSWFSSGEAAARAADDLLAFEAVPNNARRAEALARLGLTFVGAGESASFVYSAPQRRAKRQSRLLPEQCGQLEDL
jgi:hypothetical protein